MKEMSQSSEVHRGVRCEHGVDLRSRAVGSASDLSLGDLGIIDNVDQDAPCVGLDGIVGLHGGVIDLDESGHWISFLSLVTS